MADYTSSSEIFLNELMRIASNFIWKNPKKARANEVEDYAIEVEQYNLAVQGRLNFDILYEIHVEVLMGLGYQQNEAEYMHDDHTLIPENQRDLVTKKETEYIISHYVEHNNYYRMLNGLPNFEDTDYFYNTEYPEISDSKTPIHLLNGTQLFQLENTGYLNRLRKDNPEKEYLQFLTTKKIELYTARNSNDYSILWTTTSNYESLLNDFVETYEACRQMVLNIFYLKNYEKKQEEYCGFIGLTILFYTILQMHRKFLDADITREFYDEDSLRYIYDSYGVPFYSSIPMEYHKKIVKNMNILINHKGSTRVFYDLFDIFGFGTMSVFEFYMMKIHRFKDGKPIFVKNDDGSYNLQAMYDIKFAKVKLYDNPAIEMSEEKNQLEYNDLVRNDPYWITDRKLIDKIYNEKYNFMESKYLGIQTTFNLMRIIYETSYYLKLIVDNRSLLSSTAIFNSMIQADCNIFDLVIYICALIVKKYGYSGNIPTEMHEIGKVMGFNFKDDLETLKENISKNDYLKNDTKLLDYLSTMNVNSLDSIKVVYTNLTNLREYLSNKMINTDKVKEYWAYYNLYNTIMYSEYINGVFMKKNGVAAKTFAELLQDINGDLYKRYSTESLDFDQEISDSLYLLKSSCNTLKNIQYADSININTIIEYLFKLLDFFNSAKADLTGYELIYSLISKFDNVTKFMDEIEYIKDDHTGDILYSFFDEIMDDLHCCKDYEKFEPFDITFLDKIAKTITIYPMEKDNIDFIDCLRNIIDKYKIILTLEHDDFIGSCKDKSDKISSSSKISDQLLLVSEESYPD